MTWEKSSLEGSEARLWGLIEERCRIDADVEAIDARIWDLFGEDWCVMFTDLTGFSRQTARFGITHFLRIIYEHQKLLLPIVRRFDGILVKSIADSMLIVFRRPEPAMRCAIEMQRACHHTNLRRNAEEQILVCLGLGFGRILKIGDVDVYGEEVNAASKLGEDIAKAGEVLVTEAMARALGAMDRVTFDPIDVVVPGSDKNFAARFELVEIG